MRGFEIHLNDKLLCVAAFHGEGCLIAAIDHIYQESSLGTRLRALGSPHAVLEHLYFTDTQLKGGDEVLVRIVETDHPTDPIRREDVSIPSSK
jgi:hypothetical protein